MSTENLIEINNGRFKIQKYYFAALGAYLGAFSVGTAIGYCSPSIQSLRLSTSRFRLDSIFESWFACLFPLGAFFGGIVAGKCIDLFGRKNSLMLSSLPFMAGWLIITYAINTEMLLTGRFVTGFCSGLITLCAPVYIAETAPVKNRGLLVSGFQLALSIGILYSYILGTFLVWSYLAIYCSILPFFLLITMCFLPDTPIWLIKVNKIEKATEAIFFLYGEDHNLLTLKLMKNDETQKTCTKSYFDLFTKKEYRSPFVICMFSMFFQQFSGCNAIIFYAAKIFESAKSSLDSNYSTIIIGLVSVIFTVVSCFLVDKMGRKILLIISGLLMGVSMVSLATYYFLAERIGGNFTDKWGWVPLVCLILFIIFFAIGYGPIPWLLMGELLPIKVKGPASGLVTSFNWICIFILTWQFNILSDKGELYYAFLVLGLTSLVSVFYTYYFVLETKGKSLKEIELFFKNQENLMEA